MTSPIFARSVTFKGYGSVLWVLSFIGTTTAIVFKKEGGVEDELVPVDTEPVQVRRQGEYHESRDLTIITFAKDQEKGLGDVTTSTLKG